MHPSRCGLILVTAAIMLPLVADGAEAQAADVRSEYAEVNDRRLHYRTTGSGPPLLLLHGFTGAGAWWDSLLPSLSENYTTVVPDLPGHGSSQGRDGAYRYEQVAADLYALMDELGFTRFRAIGYSAGGIILLHMATQQPDRIESMALVSAIHVLPDAVGPVLASWPSFDDSPSELQAYWLGIHPGGRGQVEGLLDALRGLPEVTDNMSFTSDQLSTIKARTLLIVGDRDDLVPLDLVLEMHDAIPNSALWTVPQQGHSPLWPDWGGSAEAASTFPGTVQRFLGVESLTNTPGE